MKMHTVRSNNKCTVPTLKSIFLLMNLYTRLIVNEIQFQERSILSIKEFLARIFYM